MKTPVIVVGYNRANTIELVLRNLANCHGVRDRDIFVYIDGPRCVTEKVSVEKVIRVIQTIRDTQLPNIILVKRDKNLGCRENIVQAVTEILGRFDRMCLLEDDVLPSRTFLNYMDGALDFYKDDARIFNINAYVQRYLKIPKNYEHDVYLDLRNHTPGWGIWKNRWDAVDFNLSDWDEFKKVDKNREKVDSAGCDLFRMIDTQANSPDSLNAWDVQCSYHMIKHGLYSLAPRYTITKNIGFGMKSEHCAKYNPIMPTQKYYDFMPTFAENLQPCKKIIEQIKFVTFDPHFSARLIRKLHRFILRFSPSYMMPLPMPDRIIRVRD